MRGLLDGRDILAVFVFEEPLSGLAQVLAVDFALYIVRQVIGRAINRGCGDEILAKGHRGIDGPIIRPAPLTAHDIRELRGAIVLVVTVF